VKTGEERSIPVSQVYFSPKEFSEKSGLPLSVIKSMLDDGKIKGVELGRSRFVHYSELERLQEILEPTPSRRKR